MADLTANIAIKLLDAFTGPLRKMAEGLEEVEKRGERVKKAMSFAADLNQAAEAMGRFGNSIVGPLRGAIDEFADFDHALSKMSAMSDGAALRGSANFEMLKQQAVDLGASTQYSAREVAELQTEYLKANFSVAEAASVTEQTLAAAAAEGLGLAETASIVGGALRGMGLGVSETARVTDVLSKMSVKSKSDMKGLGEALGYAAGPASQLGLSIEKTAAMLGVLANNNIEGSRAGTSMNAVLKGIVRKPTADDLDAWKKLGIFQGDLVKMRKAMADNKPEEALARVAKGLKGLSRDKQVQMLQRIFGDEGAGAAGFLIRASVDASDVGLKKMVDAAEDANGSTLAMAKIMQEDLKGAIERAGGALSGLKTQIGEALGPAASSAANAIEGSAGALQAFVKENPKFSKATFSLVGAAGLAALGLQGLLTMTASVTAANAFLSASYGKLQASMMGRFGLVASSFALGAAVGTWLNDVLELDDKISSALGRPKGGQTNNLNTSETDQVTAGGWRLSKEGRVLDRGQGPGPVEVQRAIAAGASSDQEISAFIAADRKARATAPKPFSVVPVAQRLTAPGRGGPLAAYMRDEAALNSPLAGQTSERDQAAVLKDLFAPVLEELRKSAAAQKKTADALAERNRVGSNLDLPTF